MPADLKIGFRACFDVGNDAELVGFVGLVRFSGAQDNGWWVVERRGEHGGICKIIHTFGDRAPFQHGGHDFKDLLHPLMFWIGGQAFEVYHSPQFCLFPKAGLQILEKGIVGLAWNDADIDTHRGPVGDRVDVDAA